MNDSFSTPGSPGRDTAPSGSGSGAAEAIQQALRAFGPNGAGAEGGALTPEMLTRLAQRAGFTSPEQIANLAQMMGLSTAPADADLPQHIVFALGDADCAFSSEAVQGVERLGDVTPVPNTAPWVLGILNLHGAIISVVDLRGFFGMPPEPITPRTRLLVLTAREMTIGMIVDAVTEMRTLDIDQAPTPSLSGVPPWAEPYVSRAVSFEGRTILLLDPERLLFADQMHHYRADFS